MPSWLSRGRDHVLSNTFTVAVETVCKPKYLTDLTKIFESSVYQLDKI